MSFAVPSIRLSEGVCATLKIRRQGRIIRRQLRKNGFDIHGLKNPDLIEVVLDWSAFLEDRELKTVQDLAIAVARLQHLLNEKAGVTALGD